MNIGVAAERSGLPAKTIRYYEDISLVKPERTANGYRDYAESDIRRLTFLQRARNLGFSIEECRLLLSLYGDKHRASADVKVLAQQKVEEIETKIRELESLKSALVPLVKSCHGDDQPDCPILDDLAGLPSV
jgi:MerR family transcriptional regulator, copper efflux regulator